MNTGLKAFFTAFIPDIFIQNPRNLDDKFIIEWKLLSVRFKKQHSFRCFPRLPFRKAISNSRSESRDSNPSEWDHCNNTLKVDRHYQTKTISILVPKIWAILLNSFHQLDEQQFNSANPNSSSAEAIVQNNIRQDCPEYMETSVNDTEQLIVRQTVKSSMLTYV